MSATSFEELGLRPEIAAGGDRERLHHPHPHPGASHPGHPRRQGRHGRRPDRHRQDGRLRASDPAPPAAAGEHEPLARAASGARADPRADARARDPGRGGDQGIRQVHGAALHVRLRRRRHQAAAGDRARRRRDPGRHAGTSARSRRAEERQPVAGRDLRARRSRPHAGHGIHPRHQADHGAAARDRETAEPAVLGDLQQRDQEARRPAPERTGTHRGRAPQHRGRDRRAERVQVPAGCQARAAHADREIARPCARCCASCAPSTARRASRASSRRTASRRRPSTATRRRARASTRSPRSRKASSRCWWPPTSRRAASTSTTCRWSSTTSCPHVPEDYIHRIGRTGRAGATGEAISLVAPEEEKYLSEIERMLKKKIPMRGTEGFDPVAASERKPAPRARRCARSRAGGGQERHCSAARTRAQARRRAAAASRSAKRRTRAIPTSRCRAAATARRKSHDAWPSQLHAHKRVRCPRCS